MLHMKIDPAAAGRRAVVLVVAGAAAALERHIDNAGSELMRSMPGERAAAPRRQAG